jgi:hypothetical protein
VTATSARSPLRFAAAALVVAALAGTVLAGCGDATVPTSQASEKWIGASGSAGAPKGSAQIAVTGAQSVTVDRAGTCTAGSSALSGIYEGRVGDAVYLLQITADHPAVGQMPIGPGTTTLVELSDSSGHSWASDTDGSSGHVTVDPGLTSGSVDVKLVSPTDKSSVNAKGTWSCR